MMDTTTVEPFADVTLEYLAGIIAGWYTGSSITLFFRRAGFPQYTHDGSTKKSFVYRALQEIQASEDGSIRIKKIIEQFCNPKERVSEECVDDVRKILDDYNLTITTNGKLISQSKLPDAVDIIERIAQRFHLVDHQLKKRHDGRKTLIVSGEYDVQDLFHAVEPHYPVVEHKTPFRRRTRGRLQAVLIGSTDFFGRPRLFGSTQGKGAIR